jgi:N-acetylmuramoyl-L-alanine amidase
MRRRLVTAFIAVALAAQGVLGTGLVAFAAGGLDDIVSSAVVSPRAFSPNGDGVRDTATLTYALARAATVTVDVVDWRGSSLVRRLVATLPQDAGDHDATWDGRYANGQPAWNAGYRFRLTVTNEVGTFSLDRPIVRARSVIFSPNPGAITVAIDAGHGGPDPGAVRTGLYEKTANLEIALRLRAMLIGAGVNVVMTRTRDTKVNVRGVDWTGDGVVAYRDELASRIEVANAARADVWVVVHNNGTPYKVGGTETWYDGTRPFGAINRTLAASVQRGLLASLAQLRTRSWRPRNREIHSGPFYVVRKYRPSFIPRPSLMPGILGESLAMGHPYELRLLKSSRGRQAIAEGYYEGLAQFLATRSYGARYALVDGAPASLQEGAQGSVRVAITNGTARTWAAGSVAATLSAVPAVRFYDGSNAAGLPLATVPLPEDLAPGESVEVDLPFTAPAATGFAATGGRALLKVDLVSGAQRFASAGVPPLQLPLTITAGPTPTPTAEPTATPTAEPTAEPTATATATPTAEPTAEPTATATATPTAEPTAEPVSASPPTEPPSP